MSKWISILSRPAPSFGVLIGLTVALSCSPLIQPKVNGITASDAQEIAIRAVRTTERDWKLDVQAFDTHPTQSGNYAVSLQRKTTTTTADHWRVIVHPDRSAEVLPAEPAASVPETMHAQPTPLKGDMRQITAPDPESLRVVPKD